MFVDVQKSQMDFSLQVSPERLSRDPYLVFENSPWGNIRMFSEILRDDRASYDFVQQFRSKSVMGFIGMHIRKKYTTLLDQGAACQARRSAAEETAPELLVNEARQKHRTDPL
jgi:hypothetical protein